MWSTGTVKEALQGEVWKALLVIRADLHVKQLLRVPPPRYATAAIIVPFQVCPSPHPTE